jgi:hypothetical protein
MPAQGAEGEPLQLSPLPPQALFSKGFQHTSVMALSPSKAFT